jgi:hypothetical protein
MLKLGKQKPSLNTKHLNCLFQRNSYIINNLRKNKVFLFCAKKQGLSAWRQNNRAKPPLGNWLVKLAKKKVDRLAQLLNFAGFALYAVRRAVNFDEIDPLCHCK